MLNQSVIVGRLVKDPELYETENGNKVTNITLAVPRSYKNVDGEYDTDYISCTLWKGIAENTATYVVNSDKLTKVTEDNSDVWFYHKYGNINKEDLRYFSTSNFINACIGLTDELCKVSKYVISNDYEILLLLTDGVTDLITDRKIVNIIKKSKSEEILKKLIHEALYVDQHLFVPFRLKNKYLSSYTVPYKGRDNASGVIYIKKKI